MRSIQSLREPAMSTLTRTVSTALMAALLAALAAGAQAQSGMGMSIEGRKGSGWRTTGIDELVWRQQRDRPLSEAEQAVQGVTEAIGQRDCAAAVKQLNAGLAKGHPQVMVLAATMYEDGLCLRQNWDRAVALLQRAHGAGSPVAAARLAAGYAAPVGGGDKPAAVWWGLQAGLPLPPACRVEPAVVADADKFVAAVGAWPAGQLERCAFAAGVLGSVIGQFDGGELADAYALVGELRFAYTPGAARIEVGDSLGPAAGSGDAEHARERRAALVAQVRKAVDAALTRYARPAGLDGNWAMSWTLQLKPAA